MMSAPYLAGCSANTLHLLRAAALDRLTLALAATDLYCELMDQRKSPLCT